MEGGGGREGGGEEGAEEGGIEATNSIVEPQYTGTQYNEHLSLANHELLYCETISTVEP